MPEQDKESKINIGEKTVNWLQAFIMIASVIGVGFKMNFDISSNRESIQQLKDNQSKNVESIQEIKTNTAVTNVRLESVDSRVTDVSRAIIKIDEKIDDLKKEK